MDITGKKATIGHGRRPLRIGFDTHGCQGIETGLGRYVQSLLQEWLSQDFRHELHVFCTATDLAAFQVHGYQQATWHVGPAWHRRASCDVAWHNLELPFVTRDLQLDVLFVHTERRIPWWCPAPVVATVHDLAAHEVHGKYGSLNQWYSTQVVPHIIRKTPHLIAVSHTTAKGLNKRLGIPLPQITVIPNGVHCCRFAPPMDGGKPLRPVIARLPNDAQFLLFPGRIEHPAKNHVMAIATIAELQRRGHDIHLVCAGKDWLRADAVHQAARDHQVEAKIHFTGYISDIDLVGLYHHAQALIFPSRVEGFGLPLVEAMAANLPIISSNASCMPEIAGPAALYADPDDACAFADHVISILTDPQIKANLIHEGQVRVTNFSWTQAAAQTLRVIERAARSVRSP